LDIGALADLEWIRSNPREQQKGRAVQRSTAAARRVVAQWAAASAGGIDDVAALYAEFDELDTLRDESTIEQPPSGETVHAVLASDPVRSIAEFLGRLDPARGGGVDALMAIELADVDVTCTLHVQDGTGAMVLDSHRPPRRPDLSVSMSYYVWACLQVADISIDEAVGTGLVDTADPAGVIAFFDMFAPAEQT
jgi:hypothetical protein